MGAPNIWDPSTVSVSTKHPYFLSSTWAPCGQLVALVSEKAAEIWDALGLKLLSTLELPETTTRFKHGLAYSPDGHSLAGCCRAAIIIWDTQTGGVAKMIECKVAGDQPELVWSLDGERIALSLKTSRTLVVYTCEVASGTLQSSGKIQLARSTQLWAHNKSFQVMAMTGDVLEGWMIDIFDVGSTLTKIQSFPFHSYPTLGAFSPTTHRIAACTTGGGNIDDKLLILEAKNSKVLLQETGKYWNHCFSPDGAVFASVTKEHLVIWRYTSRQYIQWRKFPQAPMSLQFSPTSSSILGHAGPLLNVLHLDHSSTTTGKSTNVDSNQPLDAFSPDSTYIATTCHQESTVTITNLHSQNPLTSQVIDTGLKILAMVLTGNVLLVKSSSKIIAWLLTEEGIVNGVCNRRANCDDCIWEALIQTSSGIWARFMLQESSSSGGVIGFSVKDDIVAISQNDHPIQVYHTRTGEILSVEKAPMVTGYQFHHPLQDHCNQYHRSLLQPSKCDWPISQATLKEGWVKDPEGRYKLWLHPHWRSSQNDIDWLYNVTTLRLKNRSLLVLIKF